MKEHLGLYLLIALAPLVGSIVVGLFGRALGEKLSHWICIVGVAISFVVSIVVYPDVANGRVFNGAIYTWLTSGDTTMSIGFLIDRLTVLMMLVVSFVSLMVHIYTIGAMGKSAQVPLHVWLPDSMEGPTPISALIHAATMVTAGIFMVARMSPLFEQSDTALSVVIVIGAITAFFMGLLGIVQNDIKRVVAYSTLSQLGYMTAALGVSAYS